MQHVTRHLNNDLINDIKLGGVDSEPGPQLKAALQYYHLEHNTC